MRADLIKCTDGVPNLVQWVEWNAGLYAYMCKLFDGRMIMIEQERVFRSPPNLWQLLKGETINTTPQAFRDAEALCIQDYEAISV